MKTVFVHPERCIGCKQCEVACAVAHSQSKNLFLAVFESPAPKQRIHVEPGLSFNTSFPNKCRHCNPAPCLIACPTGALSRAGDMPDIVLSDSRKCLACGMCAMVCPFGVITFYPSAAAPGKAVVATKCDHCIDRQRDGFGPACVEACKTGALEFGEINEVIKSARVRYSDTVSEPAGRPTDKPSDDFDSVEAWRGWGAAVANLNAVGKKRLGA